MHPEAALHVIGYLAIFLLTYFFGGWVFGRKVEKFAWVDFLWSSSFLGVIGILTLILGWPRLPHPAALLVGMTLLWSTRLSFHLFHRIRIQPEDPRYESLKVRWGGSYAENFLYLFLAQGILVMILSIPLLLVFLTPQTGINWLHLIALGLFGISLYGEWLADFQLRQFKLKIRLDSNARYQVCDQGLWRYSRHPNYFFEILIWVSFGIFNISSHSPWNWLGLLPTAIMVYLITYVTGIRPAEVQAIRSRGDAYRDYQKRTSKLIPWKPKRIHHA